MRAYEGRLETMRGLLLGKSKADRLIITNRTGQRKAQGIINTEEVAVKWGITLPCKISDKFSTQKCKIPKRT